jgi:inosine-uridine nucleoside N-ribohydrolase
MPVLCALLLTLGADPGVAAKPPMPVILDTDIGDDIDDTWALSVLLKSPEVDLKLVVGDFGNTAYRARIVAKLLDRAGRSDVAVGLGLDPSDRGGRQAPWIADYPLTKYPGKVLHDGAQAIVDTVMASPTPVTIIAIAPPPTLAEALRRQPQIAAKARLVGMFGSLRRGYGGPKPDAEWNVKANPAAAKAVLSAPWDITITPLDTCGLVHLTGGGYAALRDSADPVVAHMIENYRVWCGAKPQDAQHGSSTLFDTVAAYLAISTDLCVMEDLNVTVTDDGFTKIDPQGKMMHCATGWKDLDGYYGWLVRRLLTGH